MEYGLNTENARLISEKAKSKKDGVYKFRGVLYKVKNNYVTHYFYNGEFLQRYGAFNVLIKKLSCYKDQAVKILKSIE